MLDWDQVRREARHGLWPAPRKVLSMVHTRSEVRNISACGPRREDDRDNVANMSHRTPTLMLWRIASDMWEAPSTRTCVHFPVFPAHEVMPQSAREIPTIRIWSQTGCARLSARVQQVLSGRAAFLATFGTRKTTQCLRVDLSTAKMALTRDTR